MRRGFNKCVDAGFVRSVMSRRTGEVLTDIVGDEKLKKLFEGQQVPDDLKDKSSGEIAVALGIVPKEVKDAIILAMVAERTFRLADKAEKLGEYHNDLYSSLTKVGIPMDENAAGLVPISDKKFSYALDNQDPPVLQKAQAAWVTAQLLLNNQIIAINDVIKNPGYLGVAHALSAGDGTALKQQAIDDYAAAGAQLAAAGYEDAGQRLSNVAEVLQVNVKVNPSYSAQEIPGRLLFAEQYAAQQVNIALNGNYQEVTSSYEETCKKLTSVLSVSPANPPTAQSKQKLG